MGGQASFFHGYGVRIQDDADSWELQERIGYPAPVFHVSAMDHSMHWILVSRPDDDDTDIEAGQYVKIEPYQATDGKYPEWDWILVETAQKHGLEILDGPAWFFISDYG